MKAEKALKDIFLRTAQTTLLKANTEFKEDEHGSKGPSFWGNIAWKKAVGKQQVGSAGISEV